MATPLNLYATKVFAEQPLALWALDDQADYISFLSASDQDLDTWTSTGVTSVVDATDENVFDLAPPSVPIISVKANGIISAANNNGLVTFTSPFQLNPSELSPDMKTFSFGMYVYSYSKIIDLRIGYRYTSTLDSQVYEVIKAATTSTTLAWAAVSETFEIPENFSNLELIIEVYYIDEGAPYEFVFNGITAGQWAEEFQLESLGVNLIDVPNTINILETKGIEAKLYGLSGSSGYYIADNNRLMARNTGMPLVYGAEHSTKILPKDNSPSLILPGFGFMSESGKNKKFTAEFWIKIQSRSVVLRKIFGPIASTDGIYADGPFVKLRIGNLVGSHFIREWDRPMLFDIRISSTRASLIINGEEVIGLDIQSQSYVFPEKTSFDGLQQDWLGFYAYEDIPRVFVDSVAIYPYEVANVVAKRRWVYGQAVEVPTSIKGLDSTNTVAVDYPFSEYTKNYYFPNTSSWSNGIVENLVSDEDYIAPPNHPLPTARLNTIEESIWLNLLSSANAETSDTFISMRPDLYTNADDTIEGLEGYLYFANLNFLLEQTKAFYGIFETSQDPTDKQTLFKVTNDTTSNYVEIYLKKENFDGIVENIIYYTFNIKKPDGSMQEDIFYKARGQRAGDRFLVGLDIPRFVRDKGQAVANFFGTRQSLKLYVGGTSEFQNTFEGKIRRVAFCNARNLTKIQHFFSSYGVPVDYENVFGLFGPSSYDAGGEYFGSDVSDIGDAISPPPEYWSLILDGGDPYDFVTIGTEEHVATYTLLPKRVMDNFYLDIEVNSYWEDYVPLSYFAKEMEDGLGNTQRYLSYLQFNVGYPRNESFNGDTYNTNGALVKSYVSFQYIEQGANSTTSSFSRNQPLNKNRIVEPGENWMNTRYEVVDGTIIYPPSDISFERLSINVHLDIEVDGILTNPMTIRSLQLSSQSFNDSPKKIGTRFGTPIIPFSKAGSYFNYRNVPPVLIDKGSSPYLYQTENTGIRTLGNFDNENRGGLSMPINRNAASFFKIGSMQMFLRYDEDEMPRTPTKIFELETLSGRIDFYLIADSSTRIRGQIYAVNASTNRLQSGIMFFTNGKPVKRPIVYTRDWSVLGMSFPDFLNVSGSVGALRTTSPIRFDHVSYYQTSIRDDEERFGFRQWFSVRNRLGEDIDWGYWAGKEAIGDEVIDIPGEGFTWQEVLFLSAILREELDASNIYDIYMGISRIIAESDNSFVINNYNYNIYRNIRWQQNVISAV
jgi:hypothetical protein